MTRPARLSRRSWVVVGVAAIVLVVDQITKSVALSHLSAAPRHVIGPFGFELTYNSGSAFSLFQGRSGLLFALDVALVAVMLWVGLRARSLVIRVGAGLVVGGALGNMADRVFRHHGGEVVDFITLRHWPTFNAADAAITIGALVLAAGILRDSSQQPAPGEEP